MKSRGRGRSRALRARRETDASELAGLCRSNNLLVVFTAKAGLETQPGDDSFPRGSLAPQQAGAAVPTGTARGRTQQEPAAEAWADASILPWSQHPWVLPQRWQDPAWLQTWLPPAQEPSPQPGSRAGHPAPAPPCKAGWGSCSPAPRPSRSRMLPGARYCCLAFRASVSPWLKRSPVGGRSWI